MAEKGGRSRYPFLDNVFKTINVLTRSLYASHSSADDSLDNDFEANDWIIKVNQPQALDDLAVLFSTLDLLEEKNFITSANSSWALKPVISTQILLSATIELCAAIVTKSEIQ